MINLAKLFNEVASTLPITGADIIEKFDLPPGPAVGRMLRRAKQIFDQTPCSRDALLAALTETEPTKITDAADN